MCGVGPAQHPFGVVRGLRMLLSAALLVVSAASAAPESAPAAPPLVVLVAIDGLPMRQLTALQHQWAPDGFARFLNKGAWFANAHHGHAHTVTAAGHAAMLTGAYPERTGIIANEWRDAVSGERVYCTADTSARYIGHATRPLDGTSPKNLRVQTVGDVLRQINPGSRVIGISGKDRGAILLAGHQGTAYVYMGQTGQFASSTYYMPAHPAWVDRFNAARPADRYFKTQWTALLPAADYVGSVADDQPWFGPRGGRLPMLMGTVDDTEPGPLFYTGLLKSPFADELTLDFARAALAGERLGQGGVPDILAISLSGHDYVNHAYSAESRLSHDHLLHLDRMLQAFFQHLDARVGRDSYVVVLTADHGFMPAPEVTAQQGREGGRISSNRLLSAVNAGLKTRFGANNLAPFFSGASVLLDREHMAQRRLDAGAVALAARDILLAEPGVGAAYTREELTGNRFAGQPVFDAMRRAWSAERSGDVQYVLKPYWMFGSTSSVATHGSPHAYDTHVPLLMYGPRWIRPGRKDARVHVVDIAPTVARLLRIPAPATGQGLVLADTLH